MPASSPCQLSVKTLKYISSIALRIAPMSPTRGTRSLRLLLASLPTKPPAGSGLAAVPQASLATVASPRDQRIKVTYSDKKAVELTPANMSVVELIRKIEEPARALRNKEEGL